MQEDLFATKAEIELNDILNKSDNPKARELYNLINFNSKQVMSDYDLHQWMYLSKDLGASDKAQMSVFDTLKRKYIP